MTVTIDRLAQAGADRPQPCPAGLAWLVDHIDDLAEGVCSLILDPADLVEVAR